MSAARRVARRLIRAFLPIVLVVLVALISVTAWLVHGITRPPRAPYLVTPQTFSKVTGPILKATDVTWTNHDGSQARGWLIRGAESSPAIILLHGYGADRSWLLNLAVKINESTNFTVLWPDLRGHGENPPVNWSLFGAVEGDDVAAAVDYLHSLKTPTGTPQITGRIGVYGVEMGAYIALEAAQRNGEIRALALDSAPSAPDELIRAATKSHFGMTNPLLQRLASWGITIYSFGKYHNKPSCELARSLREVRALLLAGITGDNWQSSTLGLGRCFSSPVEVKKDLPVTGVTLPSSTGEQEEAYDRPLIEFFDKALR
jgi:pimeloyl-ACP methyl ester carboxylesterase